MISNYTPSTCNYRLDKLLGEVYLISESCSKAIYVDGYDAYVTDIDEEPLLIRCYDVSLSDSETLDERYRFSHTLSFSVNGHADSSLFQGRFFVIVHSVNGSYWLLNPLFPVKVTYSYTLSQGVSRTDFSISTDSNHPTLPVTGFSPELSPIECKEYRLVDVRKLFLNESKHTVVRDGKVYFTNDGFKEVVYEKNSLSLTETFDGKYVNHTISFNVRFSTYKSSWHYSLLEFQDNTYISILDTSEGVAMLGNTRLQPSYTVTANDENAPDNIEITLSSERDSGSLLYFVQLSDLSPITETHWDYTSKYGGYECTGSDAGGAWYLLQEEMDGLNNPTGRYKIYYTASPDMFPNLDIVGVFYNTELFYTSDCAKDNCLIETSLPSSVTYNSAGLRTYNLKCDSDWTITSTLDGIQVVPSSGEAGVHYEISLSNITTPTSEVETGTVTVNYCSDKSYLINVTRTTSQCFENGGVFEINKNGGIISVFTECCIEVLDDPYNLLMSHQGNRYDFFFPENNLANDVTYYVTAETCDHQECVLTFIQHQNYTRWIGASGYVCVGTQKWAREQLYTSTDGINWTPTSTYRAGSMIEEVSADCAKVYSRWSATTATTCAYGHKYVVERMQNSIDGETWSWAEETRLGEELEDQEGECAEKEYEYRWILTDFTACGNA